MVKFIVDGDDALAKREFPESYEKIEITSLSHDELTLRLITEALNHLSENEGATSHMPKMCSILHGLRYLSEWKNLFKNPAICRPDR